MPKLKGLGKTFSNINVSGLQCDQCSYICQGETALRLHLEYSHNSSLKSKECEKKFFCRKCDKFIKKSETLKHRHSVY